MRPLQPVPSEGIQWSRMENRKYKILIEGRHFLVRIEDPPHKFGFFTTRFVEAPNTAEAERIALHLIGEELKDMVLNSPQNPPMISVVESEEVSSFRDYSVPGAGFTWFPEDLE